VTIVGDGGTSKATYGAINVAGAMTLPLVVVIVNNQYAISIPRKSQTHARTLARRHSPPASSLQVDGNDVIAMRAALDHAIKRARTPAWRDADRSGHLSPVRPHDRGRRAPLSIGPPRSRTHGRASRSSTQGLADRAEGMEREGRGSVEGRLRRKVDAEVNAYLGKRNRSRPKLCSTSRTRNCRSIWSANDPTRWRGRSAMADTVMYLSPRGRGRRAQRGGRGQAPQAPACAGVHPLPNPSPSGEGLKNDPRDFLFALVRRKLS
jgi:hypothetical protein